MFGNNNLFGARPFPVFNIPPPPVIKTLDPEFARARKRLHIPRSDITLLSTKERSGLSKPTTKKILNKVFKRDPKILLPIDCDFYALGKSFSPLIKGIKVLPKARSANRAFMDPPFKKEELKRITKMIKTCKRLRYLDVHRVEDPQPSFLKPLRKLSALNCLILQLGIRYIMKGSPFPAFLSQLKRLHLRINSAEEQEEEEDEDETVDQPTDKLGLVQSFTKFSQEMSSKLKNLNHFEFLFVTHRLPGGELCVPILLSSFTFPKLEKFFYSFYVANFTLDVQNALPLLKKVEHLGFFAERPYGFPDSLKISSHLFFFIAEDCKINDADIIKSCSSLKKLSVRTCFLSSFKDEETQSLEIPSTVESFNLMVAQCNDNLQEKEINSWLLALPNLPVLKKFNLTIWPWGAKSYEKLKKLHEFEALKHLESYQLSVIDYDRFKLERDLFEDITELLKDIGHVPEIGFKFKRSVEVFDKNMNFWKILEENKNLKSLFFSLPEGRSVYKIDFPYQKLAGLTNLERLEMEIPPGFEKERILGQLPKLEKLKPFAVRSSEPSFWAQEIYITKFDK